jgi:hypothetical protein
MAYDERLAGMLRDALAAGSEITEKRMMGGVCFFHRGNMVCGADHDKIEGGRLMFRVGKAQESAALARPGAIPVVLGGRRMGGLVFVDETACTSGTVREWIDLAMTFVEHLPPKS